MKNLSLIGLGMALTLVLFSIFQPTQKIPLLSDEIVVEQKDWREDYAYNLGVTAMHYLYPYWRMAHVRYDWTMKELPEQAAKVIPNNALNQFWNASILANAEWKEGGGPNNDTFYSSAWLHVESEPMIISVPPMDRFYSFQMTGPDSDNFAYISELKHGRQGGHYALLPQGWQGTLPEGVTALSQVPAPWVLVAGRTYIAGEQELDHVTSLMNRYLITPLSKWGNDPLSQWDNDVIERPSPKVFKPYDTSWKTIDDPLAVWRTINYMLTENPPLQREFSAMSLFKEINIGSGLKIDELDEASKRGLARAAVEGFRQIKAAKVAGAGKSFVKNNGWVYTMTAGRMAVNGDYLVRAVHQSYGGLIANDPDEAMYMLGFTDANGQLMNGKKRYQIHFAAGAEPEAKAFWSYTLYDMDANLSDNPIDRYSIGDRTPGLIRAEDGSLTIALQHEKPTDPQVNWLPTPKGPFWMMLRAYQPGDSVLSGQWQPPAIQEIQ